MTGSNDPRFFTIIPKGLTLALLAAVLVMGSCSSQPEKPQTGSEKYRKAVSDFYISLAAIQADQALFAVEKMQGVAEAYPEEASAWANLAVFSMRQGNFEKAVERIDKALDLAPQNARMHFLSGIIESRQGDIDEAVGSLRKAAQLDPTNSKIAFALAEELERQDDVGNAEEIFSILSSVLEQKPDNLAVLLEMVRTAVKWENRATLEKTLARMAEQADGWPPEIRRQFEQIRDTILEGQDNVTFQLAFLRNNLNQLPRFRRDLEAVQLPPNQVGFLITEFTWLPRAETAAAEADSSTNFAIEQPAGNRKIETVQLMALSDQQETVRGTVAGGVLTLEGMELAFPGKSLSAYGLNTIDYNYDFLNDIALAGSGGFRLYRQQDDSTFTDVTPETGLSREILNGTYYGSWSRDVDLDGDLDIVLAPQQGTVTVLRNNGDGTFGRIRYFDAVSSAVGFRWADLDRDGDPDAVFLDREGRITLYSNERSGSFELVDSLPIQDGIVDIEIADFDYDGGFDLLAWNEDGVHAISYDGAGRGWKARQVLKTDEPFRGLGAAEGRLFVSDLDNNGANDILASTASHSMYWLTGSDMEVDPEGVSLRGGVSDIADIDGDTRLDLVGVGDDAIAWTGINSGSKDYLARVIRPRASGPLGDRRINSFGIGGQIEIRSGLLYSKKMISRPWVHLGLGIYEEAEMLRIIWPNGSSQAEFAELGYGSKIFNEQILKGSCPWVFAYNGNRMEFVTDFLWRTGLGIRINAQGDANVIHSIDWIKIDGDQMKPRDGRYDIRITADLWETHFFDHVSLMAVDHPEGTEVYVDERFTFPPSTPKLYTLEKPRPVARAVDQEGRDVTERIRHDDRQYVDTFRLTRYQGIAEEHYLEVHLGDRLPEDRKVRLLAKGWIYPTDTSVNIAVSQGEQEAPYPLRLEVPDGKGGWKVAKENIGFPAGKSKTMVIDISDVFEEGTEKRLRLVTNMEIYWNQLQWAPEVTEADTRRIELPRGKSELRYRGFSEVNRESRFKPEQPNYARISGTTPMWYDLEGFYTRFGPVGELLAEIDDRYVIMNAGDELIFEFPAPSPPALGMERDFVLVGDGWVKDGDYNTGFSRTVLPLPYHGMKDYSREPGSVEDDPVYQQHKTDWIKFHTRYVTPEGFQSALRFDKN